MSKKKTTEDYVLQGFEGSRSSPAFQIFTDDEYIGYVTSLVKRDNLTRLDCSTNELLIIVRRLFKEGKL